MSIRSARHSGRPPTIKEVAQLAGVSFKTVARVFNREPGVRDDKRAAVLQAAETLGYTPNVSARSLASQRSFLIALLSSSSPNGYSAAAQLGAARRCRALGYNLIVETVGYGEEAQAAERLRALRVDGVVVMPPAARDGPVLRALRAAGLRHVLISPAEPDDGVPSVGMDDKRAAFDMTRCLIALGHRDIAFLGAARSRPTGAPAAVRRRLGFLAALSDAGLEPRPEYEVDGDYSFRSGAEAADRLLELTWPPTAIFAANDAMAMGVMMAGARRGLVIPAQLSVAGFDDSPSASVVWPQLTTIRQPLEEMAAAAIDILHAPEPEAAPHLTFDFELVERESTAAPDPSRLRIAPPD